jgi:hypothetical protein
MAIGGDEKTAVESDDRVGQKLDPSLQGQALLNSIPITQNEKPQLEMLAAQRALYWEAKRWVRFQVICTTIVCLAITAFGERFKLLRPYAALAGFTILFLTPGRLSSCNTACADERRRFRSCSIVRCSN